MSDFISRRLARRLLLFTVGISLVSVSFYIVSGHSESYFSYPAQNDASGTAYPTGDPLPDGSKENMKTTCEDDPQRRLPLLSLAHQTDSLGSHTYRKDGLLEVNPDGPHPIYELIESAERAWEAKLQRASKTLEDAVEEYQRRYQRLPPRGFEYWWDYAMENNVQLPDEYDSVHDSLQLYWAIHPDDLRQLQLEWEAHRDSFTIGKQNHDDSITLLNTSLPEEGHEIYLKYNAAPQIEMLQEVQQFIPPFRAVFTPHDNPDQFVSYDLKAKALSAVSKGAFINVHDPPPATSNGWGAACHPDLPLRSNPVNVSEALRTMTSKTFIFDHKAAMDVCLHPNNIELHGQFLRYGSQPPITHSFLSPMFAHSSTSIHHDIAVASPYGWVNETEDLPWDDKMDERLVWRGSTTGIWHGTNFPWRRAHRARLVNYTNTRYGLRTVLQPTTSKTERVGPGRTVKVGRLNSAMMDLGFAGEFLSCDPESCASLHGEYGSRPYQSYEDAVFYKYVMDVDGHGWSARFKRLISTNSVVLKSTVYPEWFTERIAPWVHYVPIQVDYSDIHDVLTFFRGEMDGQGEHDELARKIGAAGKEWSRKFWRKEDMTAYMFRLYLEYARVMSVDRNAMSYVITY